MLLIIELSLLLLLLTLFIIQVLARSLDSTITDSSSSIPNAEMNTTTRPRGNGNPALPIAPVDLSINETQTIHLIQVIPSATAPEMPYFQGPNITEFLD